jgi:hypothetical protein
MIKPEIRWLGREMEHAREYPWLGKLPRGFARMAERACFGNAQQSVLRRTGFRYADGEAWKEGMWIPSVHHAWVLNEEDQVIDPTWTTREESARIYKAALVADRYDLEEHLIMTGARFYYPYMCCLSDHCWCINLLGEEK